MKSYPSFVNKHYALGEDFFELAIPRYTSIDICREKILYAINNCITMEDYSSGSTDFVL